jgi:hypothetical protein
MSRVPDDEVHEFVLLEFQRGVPLAEQVEIMRQLDGTIAALDGFLAREYFYSAEERRWLDHLVWADRGAAERSERLAAEPDAAALFQRMTGIVGGCFRRAGEGRGIPLLRRACRQT